MTYLTMDAQASKQYAFTEQGRAVHRVHIAHRTGAATQCGILARALSGRASVPVGVVCLHCLQAIAPIREHFPRQEGRHAAE